MQPSNQLAEARSAMHHHSYFSAVQKSAIGTFISVSGTHEMRRLEHLSPSTHTVHSMELGSARQCLLQTYIPITENRELSSKLFFASLHHGYPLSRGVAHVQETTHTHTQSKSLLKWIKKNVWSCSEAHAGLSLHSTLRSYT